MGLSEKNFFDKFPKIFGFPSAVDICWIVDFEGYFPKLPRPARIFLDL
jgi:hypothetical protein